MTSVKTTAPTDLKKAWANLLTLSPTLRIRDAAFHLGVSEVELLAIEDKGTVIRLKPKHTEMLQDLHRLGQIMALTRNDEIVHERQGEYKNVQVLSEHGTMGLVVNEDIDLRIFFAHWHFAFAVASESERGKNRSFQFFDRYGTAIHKVFLTEHSDIGAYEKLTAKYKNSDCNRMVEVQLKPNQKSEKSDRAINIEAFRSAWSKLEDTHDFFPMLRKFGVAREQALRLADAEMARKVDAGAYKFVLEEASRRQLPIMIFVGNAGIIQIHTGMIEKVIEARGWFNVLDKRFNLHIDQEKIRRAWVVKKPTADGIVTSLELFNGAGENVALFFGQRKPGVPEGEEWRQLIRDLTVACSE